MASGEHPISDLMSVTLEKIRQMVDSNTVIGNPITTADGTTILPVSKVSFGFFSGGSDFVSSKVPKDLFGGGSGAGVSILPIAFLVLNRDGVRMIQLADKSSTVDRALNMLPEVMDKVSGLVSKGGKSSDESVEVDVETRSPGKGKSRRFSKKTSHQSGGASAPEPVVREADGFYTHDQAADVADALNKLEADEPCGDGADAESSRE